METELIRIPRERATSSWQVKVPKLDQREWECKENYEKFERLLEAYGFEKVHTVRSLKHGYLDFVSDQQVEDFGIWHHPEGMLAFTNSYTQKAYRELNGTENPGGKKLGSASIVARLDMGTGPELQHRASVGIKGSGAVDVLLDGRDVRSVTVPINSNSGDLSSFVSSVQRFGRFLPLSQWADPAITDRLFVPMESVFPLDELPGGKKMKAADLYAQVDMDEKWRVFLEALPSHVQPFFRAHRALEQQKAREHEAEKKNPGAKRKGLLWDPVELSVKRYSEALFFAKKRWRGSFDSDLLTHWSYVALGKKGEDIANWRAFEKGPAGLNLPMVLLYGKKTAPMASEVLRLLDQAPLDVLRRWATEPDAAGYTLGLHAINRLFVDSSLSSHRADVELVLGVLEKLHERLGPEGLPMATSRRSVMGLPLQFDPKGSGAELSHLVAQEAFSKVILRLEEWGLPWDQHLRWRNYPNLFQKAEGQPTFFRQDGPVLFEEWKDLLGERATEGLKPIEAILRQKSLTRSLESGPSSSARRPRM